MDELIVSLPHQLVPRDFVQPKTGWQVRLLSLTENRRLKRIQALQRLTDRWLTLSVQPSTPSDWIQALKIPSRLRLPTAAALKSELLSDAEQVQAKLLDERPAEETILTLHELCWTVHEAALETLSKKAAPDVLLNASRAAGRSEGASIRAKQGVAPKEVLIADLYSMLNSDIAWIGSHPKQIRPPSGYFLLRRLKSPTLQLDLIDPTFLVQEKTENDCSRLRREHHLEWLRGWVEGWSMSQYELEIRPQPQIPIRIDIKPAPAQP
jgi:hypothetical protein